MNVIVGIIDEKMKIFLKTSKFKTQALVIDKMCNIKYLTDPINLYIPFGKINKVGIVDKTLVHVEELVITANVKKILYGNAENKEFLEKISKLYDINLIYLNIE